VPRVRGSLFLLLCSLAGAAALSPALAVAAQWVPLDDMPSSQVGITNTNEIGLARSADGVLHVLWVNGRDDGTEALVQTPFAGTVPSKTPVDGPTTTVLTANPALDQSFNDSVELLATGGGLRALFSRTDPGGAADGVLSTATSATGSTWSAPAAASATAPALRSPVYAGAGISGGVSVGGFLYSVWGDSSPDGGGYHGGLSPADPDHGDALPFTPECCEIDPAVAVDSVSGELDLAANKPGTGIRVRPPHSTATVVAPKSAHAWTQQRTSISGRIGAHNIYLAYGAGNNMFNARPALWKVGSPKVLILKNQHDAQHVGMAPAPGGRLWVYWDRNGKIYASRTNRAATHFGAVVKVSGALGGDTFYRLDGEGSLGQLDLFALTDVPGRDLEWYTQRIAPGLSLGCAKTAKPGKTLKCDVRDAGEPVPGIDVKAAFGSHHVTGTSNAQGKVKLKVPGNAKPGNEKAETDGYPDWTDDTTSFKVKK